MKKMSLTHMMTELTLKTGRLKRKRVKVSEMSDVDTPTEKQCGGAE